MTNAAKLLMVTKTIVVGDCWPEALRAWREAPPIVPSHALYVNSEQRTLLELAVLPSLEDVPRQVNARREREAVLKTWLAGDWSREVLVHVDEVVPAGAEVPASKRVELRYIEVPLSAYEDYLDWRARTIFPSVKKHPQVESFSAYHSAFSARPGVTFLVGFSCPVSEYRKVYDNPEYRSILVTAGEKYIRGGRQALDTAIFERV